MPYCTNATGWRPLDDTFLYTNMSGCAYVSLGTTTSPSSLNWSDSEPFPTQRQQTLDDVSSIGLPSVPFISETVPPAGVQAEYVEAPEPRHLSIATRKALLPNPI